jgi:hypothetical protein
VDDDRLEMVTLGVRGARGLEVALGQGRRHSRAGGGVVAHGRVRPRGGDAQAGLGPASLEPARWAALELGWGAATHRRVRPRGGGRSGAGLGQGWARRQSDARANGGGSSDGEEEMSPRVRGLALKHLIPVG